MNAVKMKSIGYDIHSLADRDVNGLIGVESATAYWGLSSFDPEISILLMPMNNAPGDGYIARAAMLMLFVPDVNDTNVVKLSEHLSITDREQTIVDMVRYNRHEFHLYETLINAYDDPQVDIEQLEKLATSYRVLSKMKELYEQALAVVDEG